MTITFSLVLGHRVWSIEITYTPPPELPEQPWDDPGHNVVADLLEAADAIADDPLNDPIMVKASDLLREMWKMRTGPWLKQLADEDAVFDDRITDKFRPDKQPDT